MNQSALVEAKMNFHDLVEEYESHLGSIHAKFQKACEKSLLTFGGRPLFSFLRPHMITVGQYTYLQYVCRVLRNAVSRFKDMALSSEAWMDQAGLLDRERQLVDIYPGYDRLSITARWDSFMTGDALHFVELNAECPAGIAYQDVAAAVYGTLPFVKEFKKKYHVMEWELRQRLLDELLLAYRQWKGNKRNAKPRIAIVDWKEVPTFNEFQLFRKFFKQHGYDCVIADPRDLEYLGGRLLVGGKPVDLVYKRILTNDCVERPEETRALVDAYRDLNVCMINSFRAKIVHKKSIFAVLTHEKNQELFTGEELHVIQNHIPWTRKIQNETTTFHGTRIDLVEFVSHNREKFVIKPNDEYGGKGVSLGRETDNATWQRLIQDALSGEFLVVQEIVPLPREPFPMYKDGRLQYAEMVVDMDPYAYGGDVDGVLTRLSASSLANVTAGGGTTPTFVISNRLSRQTVSIRKIRTVRKRKAAKPVRTRRKTTGRKKR